MSCQGFCESNVLLSIKCFNWDGSKMAEKPQTLQSWFVFHIDTLVQMDTSPQGPAEVCRLCGFLLEIILPLVSSRFLPINNRSSVAIQSGASKPFLAVWTQSTTKRVKGAQDCTKQPRVQRSAAILESWQKGVFFCNYSDHWQDRGGGWMATKGFWCVVKNKMFNQNHLECSLNV